MPVPVIEVPMQLPMMDSQLGGSYITNAQVHNDVSSISICSLDSEAHHNIKTHFNERLNDKIYSTFKELFDHVNIYSIKEVLPKIDVYNNTIVRYVEDINLKYGVALSYTHLEVSEIGHWAEMFQVATLSNNPQQPQQPPQNQQQALQVSTITPQVQIQSLRDQQVEIDRLTIVAANWSTEESCNNRLWSARH